VPRTCLFIINGLGLGNSTRCYAVMEHLVEAGFRIHVLTSGNGLAFFQDKACLDSVSEMGSFHYSGANGGVSGWATLKSFRKLAAISRTKSRQLSRLLDRLRPDVAIVDSEYALGPLRVRKVPIIGINTSELVVTNYLRARNKPSEIRSQFWLVEFSDYLFHRLRCDLVLCPSPLKSKTRGRKFLRIGLIARRAVVELGRKIDDSSFPTPRSLKTVVFMLSGSVHASRIRFPAELPFKVEVVGVPGQSSGNVTYHGRCMNNVDLLRCADALVINGGYSAVSEAFILGRPTFVVPVPGHAEQFVNAALVRDLGLGFIASEANAVEDLLNMYEQDRWIGRKSLPAAFETNGALEAAAAIASFVERLRAAHAGSASPVPAMRAS